MKKKWKWILLFLLLIICSGVMGYFLFYQPKSKVIDETKDGGYHTERNKKDGDGEKEDTVVLNQNVYTYLGEDAKKINSAISAVDYSGSELVLKFDKNVDVELSSLEVSELFLLEGDETTPLMETYIGKVVSRTETENEIEVSVEPPALDEVFDELYLDDELQIDAGDINSISTLDGVTITPVDRIPADFIEVTSEESTGQIDNLVYHESENIKTVKTTNDKPNNFLVEMNVELSNQLLKSQWLEEQGVNAEAGLKGRLTGKAGVEDLAVIYKLDYNKKKGMEDFYIGVKGNQVMKVDLEIGFEGDIAGEATKEEIAGFLKLQGLDKKAIPVAYFDCTPKKAVKLKPNTAGKFGNKLYEELEESYEFMPFSCGFMLYIDVNGNLSLKADFNFEYKDEFENKLVIVEDYHPVGKFEGKSEPSSTQKIIFEAQADADFHVGASVQAYFFNINMADIGIIKVGTEVEGKGSFQASSDEEGDSGGDASFYARAYLKALDIKANLKTQVNLWNVNTNFGSLQLQLTFWDLTWWETGQKKDTHYDENTMKWKKVTAEDSKATYYKGLNGNLIRELNDGFTRKTIYEDEFFSICGVDQSYIYVLQATVDEQYNIRRISKDGTTSKVILKDVKYVLLMDGQKMFYVPSFSSNEIYSLDRETMKTEKFSDYENDVEYMGKESNNYFVVTQKTDAFSWLVGPDCKYYRVSFDGKTLQTYGDDIAPQDNWKDSLSQYNVATQLISNGYLRETAKKVYWMSKDSSTYIETEGCSGWNPTEVGIFTEQENGDGTYKIVLYQAKDGSIQKVTDVSGKEALFTLVQDSKNNWYYMDQTEKEFILYRMDSTFQNKEQIEKISREEIDVDEESCGMELTGNRIFFYKMPEWSESEVLYRYNLF